MNVSPSLLDRIAGMPAFRQACKAEDLERLERRRIAAGKLEAIQKDRSAAAKRQLAEVETAKLNLKTARMAFERARGANDQAQLDAMGIDARFSGLEDAQRKILSETAPQVLSDFIAGTFAKESKARDSFSVAKMPGKRLLSGHVTSPTESSNADKIAAQVAQIRHARAAAELLILKPLSAEDLAGELKRLSDLIGDI
jgi:hypothetical protein